jgi:hypothetical protein
LPISISTTNPHALLNYTRNKQKNQQLLNSKKDYLNSFRELPNFKMKRFFPAIIHKNFSAKITNLNLQISAYSTGMPPPPSPAQTTMMFPRGGRPPSVSGQPYSNVPPGVKPPQNSQPQTPNSGQPVGTPPIQQQQVSIFGIFEVFGDWNSCVLSLVYKND